MCVNHHQIIWLLIQGYGIVTLLAWWDRKSTCICFSYALRHGKALFPSWERGPCYCICGETLPFIYLWSTFLLTDRPQTSNYLVPQMASGRIMRWVLTLSSYKYTLVFRSTTQHGNGYAMSWHHAGCLKSLTGMFCWWPGMDAKIETLVQQCPECQEGRPGPPTTQPIAAMVVAIMTFVTVAYRLCRTVLEDRFLIAIGTLKIDWGTSNATVQQLKITFA